MFCNPSDGIAYILATVFPLPFHRVAASQKNENKEATNKEKSECESFFYEKKETCKIKTTLKSLKLYLDIIIKKYKLKTTLHVVVHVAHLCIYMYM
jgi:hypothetical protein